MRTAATRKSLLWIIALALVALSTLSDRGLGRGPEYRQDPTVPGLVPDPGGPPPGGGGTDGDADELEIYAAPPPNQGHLGNSGQDRSAPVEPKVSSIPTRWDRDLSWLWLAETIRRAL